MKLLFSFVIALSLLAAPAYASFCALDDCQSGAAGQHDVIKKQEPEKGTTSVAASHVGCQCSQLGALTDNDTSYVVLSVRQGFTLVHEGLAPEHEPTPLLEPPARA